MIAAGWAMAWPLWRRHRWGLASVFFYLLGMAAVVHAVPAERLGELGQPHESSSRAFGILISVPFLLGLAYLAAVFAHGFEAALEAGQSGFPARTFALPVRTMALVGWPMLQGAGTAALAAALWTALVLRPCGFEVSTGLMALLAATFLAWVQTLIWTPFGLPWLRVAVAVLFLPLLAMSPRIAPLFAGGPDKLPAVLASLLLLAMVLALLSVSRARRGELLLSIVAWSGDRAATERTESRPSRPFASPLAAQAWYEWRLHGRVLPLVIACMLPFFVVPSLFLLDPADADGNMRSLLFLVPVLAFLIGLRIGRMSPWIGGSRGLTPFLATRPLREAEFVAAKLRMAARSALTAWALVLTILGLWLLYSGHYADLAAYGQRMARNGGAVRTCVFLSLLLPGMIALTWKHLAENVAVGLAGRPWLGYASGGFFFGLLLAGLFVLGSPERHTLYDYVLPLVGWLAVGIKLVLAGWAIDTLFRRGMLTPRTLARLVVFWLVLVCALFGLGWWFLHEERNLDVSLLALVAILVVSLARPLSAPLALAWDRHR
jgi:hypothetical protein